MYKLSTYLFFFFAWTCTYAQGYILVPMDEKQHDHLKSYGAAYWILNQKEEAYWLLNYRGGSFAFKYSNAAKLECISRGVSYEHIPSSAFDKIIADITAPDRNMEAMKLEIAPKIAVYSPTKNMRGEQIEASDDAVTMVLSYAQIPYEIIYDEEVLGNKLHEYDWLHLHHEDFTGQFGKLYGSSSKKPWYREHVKMMNDFAQKLNYKKVSELKLAVVKKIQEFVSGGGFMFAMCSASDTYDLALAADGVDICATMFDGDPIDSDAQSKLNYDNTFAFKNFKLVTDPTKYEYSTIDNSVYTSPKRDISEEIDYFLLFDFSAKWDPIPTMLTQCHTQTIRGFMGQTTAYRKNQIKSNVKILGETKALKEAKYLHGTFGKGFWSFYGGHDPEDYRHYIEEPPTDLSLHPNSPGYRLILNNILFPAAKKKHRPT
ncbi:MAG: asparagine synthetase B [Aureispira sp.]|nr:asparagine synthetase B [Aureispira sp.]